MRMKRKVRQLERRVENLERMMAQRGGYLITVMDAVDALQQIELNKPEYENDRH